MLCGTNLTYFRTIFVDTVVKIDGRCGYFEWSVLWVGLLATSFHYHAFRREKVRLVMTVWRMEHPSCGFLRVAHASVVLLGPRMAR